VGLKPLVFAASLGPAASLMWAALTHQLNINPFDEPNVICATLGVLPTERRNSLPWTAKAMNFSSASFYTSFRNAIAALIDLSTHRLLSTVQS